MTELRDATAHRIAEDKNRQKESKVLLLNPKQWRYVQSLYNLTPRERQIAELVCEGLRNESIASRLHIKSGTVKTHIRNIYRKVQVKSKIAMLLQFVSEAREFSNHKLQRPTIGI
jgi:DNA-binding NarL/FixJ family response regulator